MKELSEAAEEIVSSGPENEVSKSSNCKCLSRDSVAAPHVAVQHSLALRSDQAQKRTSHNLLIGIWRARCPALIAMCVSAVVRRTTNKSRTVLDSSRESPHVRFGAGVTLRDQTPHLLVSFSQCVFWLVFADAFSSHLTIMSLVGPTDIAVLPLQDRTERGSRRKEV